MTLKEIKKQIKGASPEELVNLVALFENLLEKLSEFHVDYRSFHNEHYSELSSLHATVDAENSDELRWLVDSVIEIGDRLQKEVV